LQQESKKNETKIVELDKIYEEEHKNETEPKDDLFRGSFKDAKNTLKSDNEGKFLKPEERKKIEDENQEEDDNDIFADSKQESPTKSDIFNSGVKKDEED